MWPQHIAWLNLNAVSIITQAMTVEALTGLFCREIGRIWELWVSYVHFSREGANSLVSIVRGG